MKIKMMKKSLVAALMMLGMVVTPLAANVSYAAEEPAKTEQSSDNGGITNADGSKVEENKAEDKKGFFAIIKSSGTLGIILWLFLFGDLAAGIYFIMDSFVLVQSKKLMPAALIANVQSAMAEGDVIKALKACENEPSAMSNILSTAFQHVEDGYEVIQEAVNGAADLETERLMQRLNWISVCGNLGPSLGLLGTVQGMIDTFDKLSGSAGIVISDLAMSIGQALWTTAGGLVVSIPCIMFFYINRNRANRLIMRMTALTMELLKGLRNVEVVDEQNSAQG